MTSLSQSSFRIFKSSSVHKFQLGFVNVLIALIGLSCFTTLKFMHLNISADISSKSMTDMEEDPEKCGGFYMEMMVDKYL